MHILAPLIIIAVLVVTVGWVILKLMGASAECDKSIARLRQLQGVKPSPHLCDNCVHDFATYRGCKPFFAHNIDPPLRGAAADRVLACDAYHPTGEAQP